MPALSMFFGIIVRMQSERGGKHNKPHIHALYGDSGIVPAAQMPRDYEKGMVIIMLRPTAIQVEAICEYQIMVTFDNGEKKPLMLNRI